MSFARSDRSRLAQWWFSVDHTLLAALLTLVAAGFVLSLAASPAIALKKGLPAFYFVERHALYATLGIAIMLAISVLDGSTARRLAIGLLLASVGALVAVTFFGAEVNGARRWLRIAGHSLQPSEFVKPGFVVLSAWLLTEARARQDVPAMPLAVGLLMLVAGLLVLQPDIGQTTLIVGVWGVLLFLSGHPIRQALALLGVGLLGAIAAYFSFAHVRARIDRFAFDGAEAHSQIARAAEAFRQGGFLGRGPGEGTIKTSLPDAHTDFIFAVVAEEYGVLACLILVALFGFVVVRAYVRGWKEPRPADRLAVVGLALLLGGQAIINMGVNVGLLPAKGMTLPFISAGGSSLLSISILAGMLLAMTRRRADPRRLKKPGFAVTVDGSRVTGRSLS